MSMPTMIVASDVPPRLVERFSRGSSNVVPPAVAGYSCVRTIHNFLRARQCPESYEAQHDGSLFNTGQECHRLVDTAHCAPLGRAARKARRALPGQKARRAAEA